MPALAPSSRFCCKVAFLFLTLGSVRALPCAAQSKVPDDLPSKLRFRVPEEGHLSGVSFVEALCQTARVFQIPMGIEWVNTPSANAKRNVSWRDTSVQEMIEAIA